MADLKARIKHKIGTATEWQTAATNSQFKPLEGELIIYEDATTPRLKVGDGSKLVTELPFIDGIKMTVSGSGNAIAAASYDENTRTLTLTKNRYVETATTNTQVISASNSSVVLKLASTTATKASIIEFAATDSNTGTAYNLGGLGIFQTYPTFKDTNGNYQRLLTWNNFSINGSQPSGTSTSFWAPISSGLSGNLLVSRGSNYSPEWVDYLDVLNIGTTSLNIGSQLLYGRLGNDGTSKYQANTYISGGGTYYIDSITDSATKNRFWLSATETGSTIPINAARGIISTANNRLYLEPGDNDVAMLTVYTNNIKAYGIHRNADINSLKVHYYTDGTWAAGYTLLDENNYKDFVTLDYLPLSGGTLTGSLALSYNSFPQISFNNADGVQRALIYLGSDDGGPGTLTLRVSSDAASYEAYLSPITGYFHASKGFEAGYNNSNTYSHYRISRADADGTNYVMGSLYAITTAAGINLDVNKNGTVVGTATFGIDFSHTGKVMAVGADFTGAVNVTSSQSSGSIQLSNDDEGGTIRLYSKSNTYCYEFDAHNDETIRIHTHTKNPNEAGKSISWNGKTGTLTADAVYGAVWNDYAEYRSTIPNAKPGQVVIENGDGTLRLSTERLQPGCEVVSDTFGFAIGETNECKTPVAASGRVLVYTYEDRNTFIAGEPVCSGPNGTVSRMTREEVKEYPERIIGTVSEIPSYERWGSGNVKVNGRIWIRIR